ncbi:MAG TPA: NRDE family protein [Chitinophagaceae bacterium]|nr:NRDE family protein [Chitinophagaceae bacterium]
MCTLSYIPGNTQSNTFIITSNRDESIQRSACMPQKYDEYQTQLYYPKDKKAGGTWIGISRMNTFMSLMNGAFHKHKRKKKYRKSRGVVLKELLSSPAIFQTINTYDFQGIEPFFSILVTWDQDIKIHELVWDGTKLFLNEKDAGEPHLWSSMMSYSSEQHNKKFLEFQRFLKRHKQVSPELIWDFHHIRRFKNDEGLLIDRGELQTTSISQFCHHFKNEDNFRFEDLTNHQEQNNFIAW